MNCPDLQTISEFADSELEPNHAAEVERHVAQCASCQRSLEEMRTVEHRGRAALENIDAREANVKNVVYGKPLWLLWGRRVPLAAAAAVIAIVTVTGAWLFFNQSSLARRYVQAGGASNEVTSSSASSEQSEDAAFAQWLEPYRNLNIPLVPMEVAANYNPLPIFPTRPDNIERN